MATVAVNIPPEYRGADVVDGVGRRWRSIPGGEEAERQRRSTVKPAVTGEFAGDGGETSLVASRVLSASVYFMSVRA